MKFKGIIIILIIYSSFEISLKGKATKTFLSLFNGQDLDKANTETEQNKKDESQEETKKKIISEINEGWFSLKSPSLLKTNNFPELFLPNGKRAKFRFERESNFLLNGFFSKFKKNEINFPKDNNYFYFKTNKNLVYFTPLKNSTIILAAFRSKSCTDIKVTNRGYCIENQAEDDIELYTICSYNQTEIQKLMCSLRHYNNESLPYSCTEGGIGKIKEIPTKVTEIVKESVFVIPKAARHCNDGWSYVNKGDDWECICSEGFEQSPIELPTKQEAINSDVAPVFFFSPIPQTKTIYYSGNSLRMDATGLGTITTLNAAKYESKEIIFHTPAEHTIKEEERADMEMEIIYEGKTVGDINKQVSLSFLFKGVAGKHSKFFEAFDLVNLPNPLKDGPVNLKYPITIPYIQYLINDEDYKQDKNLKEKKDYSLKPFSFYTYQGSLSSPPCTERTIRYVAADPISISPVVIEFFKDALNLPTTAGMMDTIQYQDSLHVSGGCKPSIEEIDGEEQVITGEDLNVPKKESARNQQNLNGRQVFYWDMIEHCGLPVPEEKPISGHYEAVRRKYTQYYHLDTDTPSGLPDSFVIPEEEAKGQTKV